MRSKQIYKLIKANWLDTYYYIRIFPSYTLDMRYHSLMRLMTDYNYLMKEYFAEKKRKYE